MRKEVIMPDGEIVTIDTRWMHTVSWRDPGRVYAPSETCSGPVVPCGLPNPFAAESVAERLDELYEDRIWRERQKPSAEEQVAKWAMERELRRRFKEWWPEAAINKLCPETQVSAHSGAARRRA